MTGFGIFRVLLLGLVWAMAIIVVGIAANNIALSVGSVWMFPNLALAVSVFTHAIATPMLVISFARKGALTSRVVVELSWVGVLWMLWLAVAVVTTSTPVFGMSCNDYRAYFGSEVGSECMQFGVLQAMTWLITALLLFYSITLFTLSLLTNLWRREESSDKSEKQTNPDAIANAFFSDASSLHFFFGSLRSKIRGDQLTIAPSERRYSSVPPLYEGGHQYWTSVAPGDRDSKLERGKSTSTVGSTTKRYVPSPLSLGAPQRAILPGQSPYMTTKKATASTKACIFQRTDNGGQI